MPPDGLDRILRGAGWTAFTALALVAALYLAWSALARADFLYPVWYEVAGIDDTIATYGPRNQYREAFQATTRAERMRLFGELVEAIQDDGRGLRELIYHAPDGRPLGRLLRRPEVVHLEDVATLVDVFRTAGLSALGAWIAALGVLAWQGTTTPRPLRTAAIGLGLAVAAVLALALAGPVRVFYALHTLVFPTDHQWFFYYEESLLTMMTRAPVLFGYIGAEIAAAGLAMWLAMLTGARLLTRLAATGPGRRRPCR